MHKTKANKIKAGKKEEREEERNVFRLKPIETEIRSVGPEVGYKGGGIVGRFSKGMNFQF